MEIGILSNSYPAYQGHFQSPFIHNLAKALAFRGHRVKVVCPYYGKFSKKRETIDNVEIIRFQYFPIKFQRLTEGGGMPSALKSSFIAKINMPFFIMSSILTSIKELRKCDLIHCQWALSGIPGIFIKFLFRKPMIVTTRGAEFDLAMKNFLFKIVLRYVLKNCNFITPNNESHVEVIKKFGIPKEKILPIPNGINLEYFKPRNKRELRKKLRLPLDKKIVLFVGWLIERKGVNYLLDVATMFDDNILFLIIGSGASEENLKMYARNLNLKEKVKFLGAKNSEEIPYWMNVADVFVLPSLSEGRPNVVAEAASSGLPVIATRVDGTPELIDDQRTGFLITPRSTKELYERLKLLLENNDLRNKTGKNARQFILKLGYTWDKCADDYIKVYKRFVN